MSVGLGRPGSDPQRPHQDLRIPSRIPSQYLSQVLPSSSAASSSFTTPPVAVQIASLHRAAEVARYEWRSAQRNRQANLARESPSTLQRAHDTRSNTLPILRRTPTQTITASGPFSLSYAQRRDSQMTSRVFTSATEAYDSALSDLNRHTGAGLIDSSDTEDAENNNNNQADNTSETSTDSSNTEEEVIASTISSSTTPLRRAEFVESRHSHTPWSSSLNTTAGLSRDDNIIAESQVWDRMVNDLAIGAGVVGAPQSQSDDTLQGEFAHQRGISGGIAASMLALSAAVPRSDYWNTSSSHRGSTPPRTLPHPIWARRYPGAAGEWLRGELARRANGSSAQSQVTHTSTGIPRPAAASSSARRWRPVVPLQANSSSAVDTTQRLIDPSTTSNPLHELFSDRERNSTNRRSNWDWNALRFPSLDPASRDGQSRTRPSSEILQGMDIAAPSATLSHTNLTVPVSSRAQGPTPPLYEITHVQSDTFTSTEASSRPQDVTDSNLGSVNASTTPRRSNSQSVNREAADLVARMAQASREMAAARSNPSSTQQSTTSRVSNSSRATRGGMSYIRRLRHLDGLDTEPAPSPSAQVEADTIELDSPPQPHEVFPWYQPPRVRITSQQDAIRLADGERESEKDVFDPDGGNLSWYRMARERMASMQMEQDAGQLNNDPDGEHVDQEEGEVADSHLVGVRRRIVTSNESNDQRRRNRSALVVADADVEEGEGADNARNVPFNPVESWTLVDQRPMSPVRTNRDEGSESVTTWLREPANPTSRLSTSPLPMNDSDTVVRLPATRTVHTYRPVPINDDPRTTRRPRRLPSLDDGDVQQYNLYQSTFDGAEEARNVREETPSPELQSPDVNQETRRRVESSGSEILGRARRLTSIGRRLEEEFRARQTELRQREERLRNEVARRRLELDQVRRRQGRIGRVIDRQQDQTQTSNGQETSSNTALPSIPQISLPDESIEGGAETVPLLGEQESTLIRRRALREPRRATLLHEDDNDDDEDEAGQGRQVSIASNTTRLLRDVTQRTPPNSYPNPLDELMSRLTLQFSTPHSSMSQGLQRRRSTSNISLGTALQPLPIIAFDDHFA